MNTPASAPSRAVTILLNVAHGIDHMFVLIFAAAIGSIATEFGFSAWEDLMPYGVGAFLLFGLGSVPAGRLGDGWGRRQMMLLFFFGIGAAAMLVTLSRNVWQLAAALTVMGAFASIYHPVGIPMLLQQARNPGATIGVNGLAGNLGVAVAAVVTGFLVKWMGWRAAFVVPGLFAIACGVIFAIVCPQEKEAPAKRKGGAQVALSRPALMRAFAVMTAAAVSASLLFNFSTNGNGQLLAERFRGVVEDPAALGILLAVVYTLASVAQIVVGRMIDRLPLKPLYLWITLSQAPLFAMAAYAQGWWLFVALLGAMVCLFGAIPFIDVLIVRYVDDRVRSRVAGMRLAVAFGISSLAVYLLGPFVKQVGFSGLLLLLAAIALGTVAVIAFLPGEQDEAEALPMRAAGDRAS